MSGRPHDSFVVAECRRRYSFDPNVELVCATFSADAEVQLYVNGEIVATGPSTVGGDFLGNGKPREWFYKDKASFSPILPSPTEARKPSLPTVRGRSAKTLHIPMKIRMTAQYLPILTFLQKKLLIYGAQLRCTHSPKRSRVYPLHSADMKA